MGSVSIHILGTIGLKFRTNFRDFEGPSNSWLGDKDMGGAGQFTWDLSFDVLSMSLLDPERTFRIVSNSFECEFFGTSDWRT